MKSEFQKLLLQEFPIWSKDLLPTMGVRLINLSSNALSQMYEKNGGTALIQKMKALLPSDVALKCDDDEPLKMWLGINNTGSGTYHIRMVSEQWEAGRQEEEIPEVYMSHLVHEI